MWNRRFEITRRNQWRGLFLFVVAGFLSVGDTFAQMEEGWECGTVSDPVNFPEETMSMTQLGGKYITADGVLKALVVFVQFDCKDVDGCYADGDWPEGQAPAFLNTFIDADTSQNSTHYANLTHYFDVMSLGRFNLIGDAVHIILPKTQAWYAANNPTRSGIIRETLELLDSQVDFSKYDHWRSTQEYAHENIPDNVVDMIFMVFRNTEILEQDGIGWSGFAGEASMGWGASFQVDGGATTIKMGYRLNNGSGVTVKYRNQANAFRVAGHEFGHWLLGPHPYRGTDPNFIVWSILHLGYPPWGMVTNAFERERLGWINAIEISEDVAANVPDYLTTGVAYKYHPPNGSPDEYFYFENHQRLHVTSDGNTYDDATLNPDDKGIFVVHVRGPYNESDLIRCRTADGNWVWDHVDDVPNIWGSGTLPLFENTIPDVLGSNHRQDLMDNPGQWKRIYVQENAAGNLVYGPYFRGYLMDGSFHPNHNTVFSRWSNPNTNNWNNQATDFSMNIANRSANVVNVDFYLSDPNAGNPPKIIDLHLANSSGNPLLAWTEVDGASDIDFYEIFKSTSVTGSFNKIGESTNGSYVDTGEILVSGLGIHKKIYYRIQAVDLDENRSDFSNTLAVKVRKVTPQEE